MPRGVRPEVSNDLTEMLAALYERLKDEMPFEPATDAVGDELAQLRDGEEETDGL